ncbi:MAG TPA: hypothetical protein VNV88_07940 [Candidatus Solibacter sp.]|nr:hypothetical protein [Candidatus Solibacter sp.]
MGKSILNSVSPLIPYRPFIQKDGRQQKPKILIVISALMALAAGAAFAQTIAVPSLADRSSIIVRGKVLKINASDEHLLEPSNQTAVISIQQMYTGKEIAGDQTGRTATVILSKPGVLKAGEAAVFFGNPRFLGKSVTIADEGETPLAANVSMQSSLDQAVQAQRNKPLLDKIAAASLIFRGKVSYVQPLESSREPERPESDSPSEHSPDWHLATVEITNPLQGGTAKQQVTVVFSASRDIVWFQSPKLIPGQDAIFLAHAPTSEEETLYRGSTLHELMQKQPIYMVTEPSHVLPPAEEDRVRGLIAAPKEIK